MVRELVREIQRAKEDNNIKAGLEATAKLNPFVHPEYGDFSNRPDLRREFTKLTVPVLTEELQAGDIHLRRTAAFILMLEAKSIPEDQWEEVIIRIAGAIDDKDEVSTFGYDKYYHGYLLGESLAYFGYVGGWKKMVPIFAKAVQKTQARVRANLIYALINTERRIEQEHLPEMFATIKIGLLDRCPDVSYATAQLIKS